MKLEHTFFERIVVGMLLTTVGIIPFLLKEQTVWSDITGTLLLIAGTISFYAAALTKILR